MNRSSSSKLTFYNPSHPPLPAIFECDLLDYLSKPPVPELDAKQEIKVVPHGWMDCDFGASTSEMFKPYKLWS